MSTHFTPRSRPRRSLVNLPSVLRLLESVGSIASLILIGSVGSHFSPTYAAIFSCAAGAIISPVLLFAFTFNLHRSTPLIRWILWESIYAGSMGFLFLINAAAMVYSSIRWSHTSWWLSSLTCSLVAATFIFDWILLVRLQLRDSRAKHSQDQDFNK